MRILENGQFVMEIDNRLLELTTKDKELKVLEEEFRQALKGYKLDEFLIVLGEISAKLFDRNFTENTIWKKEKVGFIIHKPSRQFVTDFAVEYITNILLISGSNNFKKESIKNKDNIIALFSIYNNSLIHPISKNKGALALLVPMFYQQITSQQDIKDAFVRQWLIFDEAQQLVNEKERLDLDQILNEKGGMNVIQYIKLCFLILATILTKTRFNFGTFENHTISGMDDVLNNEKIAAILKQLSVTRDEFIKLDKKYNPQLKPEHTKSRYNPLWEKPIVVLGNNDYVVPSLSAYTKGALRGLYWIFENAKGKSFRDYFGILFENYCGMVLKDIFGIENVKPGIKYGKDDRQFFDWIVNSNEEITLFETKGYQFPLNTLQTGDPKLIKKEVFDKLVKTIKQMYQRNQDIQKFDELKEFRNKKLTVVAVFYDIPLVSTNLYDNDIQLALNGLSSSLPGIKDFQYIFLSIEELEHYTHVKKKVSVQELVNRVKGNPATGILSEINKVFQENNLVVEDNENLLDKKFTEFYTNKLGIKDPTN